MSDSSSDKEPDQHHEILDGGGQSTLLQLLKFTRSDQSVSSDLDAQEQDGVMVELGKIQSSLTSVENRIRALEGQSAPTKRSHSEKVALGSDDPALPWAGRCPLPQGDFAPGSW
uniref:Uncharacterized protein n=1 Tax=Amphimedon queenslandica TaxID=400682 RepID=A0A1X7UDD3_AMPQE